MALANPSAHAGANTAEQRRYHANEINIVFGVVEHQWKPNQKNVSAQFVTSRKKTQEAGTDATRQQTRLSEGKACVKRR